MPNHITYRKLRGYKYETTNAYSIPTDIHPPQTIIEPKPPKDAFITLSPEGLLTIAKGYAWDGPSGPTIDTRTFMRGSLVHDALYQLLRQKELPRADLMCADQLLQSICLEDGMCSFRAWYVYRGLRWFGGAAATPRDTEEIKIFTAP